MAYKEHPEFKPPEGKNPLIWRYMDLAKFISLIDKSALYFTRLDQLSKFDPFEGSYSNPNFIIDAMKYEHIPDEWKKSGTIYESKEIFDAIKSTTRTSRDIVKYGRETTFVNCWHALQHESSAMWHQYQNSKDGIAVQSTYDRLAKSFQEYDDFEIYIGMIKYLDYKTDPIPSGNLLYPYMHKRKSFQHENELRCLIWTPQHGKNNMIIPELNVFKDIKGLYIKTNLNELIENIFISPTSPEWIHELVKSLITKYSLTFPIQQSDLATSPLF